MEQDQEKILYGVKSKVASVKILELPDGTYIVEEKHYFFGYCTRKTRYQFDKFEAAEDKFIELREKVITK